MLETQLIMLTQSASIHQKPSEGITLWSLGEDWKRRKQMLHVTLRPLGSSPTPPQVSASFQFLINKALGDQNSRKTFPLSCLLSLLSNSAISPDFASNTESVFFFSIVNY